MLMPLPVDLPRVAPLPRARFALRDGVFQFLLVFDWHSWPARKNPAAAIAAFRLAFPSGSEPVGLAIKMIGLEPWSVDFAAFKALADADRRITLIAGTLDRPALAALYQCCDAYLSLHRAEGFGLTMANLTHYPRIKPGRRRQFLLRFQRTKPLRDLLHTVHFQAAHLTGAQVRLDIPKFRQLQRAGQILLKALHHYRVHRFLPCTT